MATIKSFNAPGKTGGFGQHGLGVKSGKKLDSGHLVSPTAFSRQTRNLKRTHKPLDKKMGSRKM